MPSSDGSMGIASTSVADALAALAVNPASGLARREVDSRRIEHGYNEIADLTADALKVALIKWRVSRAVA